MNIVERVERCVVPAAEDTRERSRGYTYLVSEILLRHSHVLHESDNSVLHNVSTYQF